MKVELLYTDGRREERELAFAAIGRAIGAETMDTVNLRDGRVMLVDDAGYETTAVETAGGVHLKPVRARKPLNQAATRLYHSVCRFGTEHQIVGDVAIVWDKDCA